MFQYAFYQSLLSRGKNVKIEKEYYRRSKTKYQLEQVFPNVKVEYASQDEIKIYEDCKILRKLKTSKHVRIRRMYDIFAGKKYQMTFSDKASLFATQYLEINSGYLIGFWQNKKYFQEIDSKIRKDFQFPEFEDERNKELANLITSCESVSVHVRRGDYVFLSSLPKEFRIDRIITYLLWKQPFRTEYAICSEKYFESAIEYVKGKIVKPTFFIFSDDPEWCKKQLNVENAIYVDWNGGDNSFRDMQLMSMCKHNVICNSTFSWWGAYLNDNQSKLVIAPEKWIKVNNKLFESDIIPDDWIKIPI